MSVDKTIKLTRSNDQSITVSSGTDTFTIAFFEVPRVSDNTKRQIHRVHKPRAEVNETKEDVPGPHNFRFTIYGSPAKNNAKDKKQEKQGSRDHFLAIKGKLPPSVNADRDRSIGTVLKNTLMYR